MSPFPLAEIPVKCLILVLRKSSGTAFLRLFVANYFLHNFIKEKFHNSCYPARKVPLKKAPPNVLLNILKKLSYPYRDMTARKHVARLQMTCKWINGIMESHLKHVSNYVKPYAMIISFLPWGKEDGRFYNLSFNRTNLDCTLDELYGTLAFLEHERLSLIHFNSSLDSELLTVATFMESKNISCEELKLPYMWRREVYDSFAACLKPTKCVIDIPIRSVSLPSIIDLSYNTPYLDIPIWSYVGFAQIFTHLTAHTSVFLRYILLSPDLSAHNRCIPDIMKQVYETFFTSRNNKMRRFEMFFSDTETSGRGPLHSYQAGTKFVHFLDKFPRVTDPVAFHSRWTCRGQKKRAPKQRPRKVHNHLAKIYLFPHLNVPRDPYCDFP